MAMKMSSPKNRPTLSVAAACARIRSRVLLGQRAELASAAASRHRRDQRPHHLRMAAERGEAERRRDLAHEQIEQQDAERGHHLEAA